MATERIAVVKTSPSTRFSIQADWVRQSQEGNYSVLGLWIVANNGPAGSTGSFSNGPGYQNVWANGYVAEHSGNPFLPSGYPQNALRWSDYHEKVFYHDASGYLGPVEIGMELGYGSVNDRFDNGRAHRGTIEAPPRISRVPSAPGIIGAEDVTSNSFGIRYQRGADNGSPIQNDHAQWATDSRFKNVVWNDYGPAGYTSPQGGATAGAPALQPNRTYYVRIRSRNAAGYGPFSATASQTTLPAGAPGIAVTPDLAGRSASLRFSPPGGVSGAVTYTYEFRMQGSSTTRTGTSAVQVVSQDGLDPGRVYEWRVKATFGGYTSPYSDWVAAYQPAPNTNPGQYFDGDTAAKPDTTYAWSGTPGESYSYARGRNITGWLTFGEGNASSGGSGAVAQSTGGLAGTFAAQVTWFTDATGAGFIMGVGPMGAAAVEPRATYYGSIHVKIPGRTQRVESGIAWYDSARNLISYVWSGGGDITEGDQWTRLIVSGVSPDNAAFAAPVARDVDDPALSGIGFGEGPFGENPFGGIEKSIWEPWRSGDIILLDAAMVTLGEVFPYFDGSTKDTRDYDYQWLGGAHASASIRYDLNPTPEDLLADPDCSAVPAPPMPPSIPSDCIVDVGVWRRYLVQIPPTEVLRWATTLPTLILNTGSFAARQVRIRIFPNPDGVAPDQLDTEVWEGELILTYIPPNTQVTLDGVTQRVWAEVDGRDSIPANHLLYGTNGVPATWPELACGVGYLITLDVPLDAPEGNLSTEVLLTQKV